MANGVLYAVSTVCLQVVIGVGTALLLHLEFRGRNWLRGSVMAPYILPTVVVVYIWKWVLDVNHGIISLAVQALGLGTVEWFSTPFMAWVAVPFLSASGTGRRLSLLPFWQPCKPSLMISTMPPPSTGPGSWQRLIYVTLPVLKPVLVVIIMLRSIFMFNKFDIVWLLTGGGPLMPTEHLPILAYQKTFRMFDIGGGAAVATSIFIFLTLLIWIYFKLFPLEEHGIRCAGHPGSLYGEAFCCLLFVGVTIYSLFPMYWMVISGLGPTGTVRGHCCCRAPMP